MVLPEGFNDAVTGCQIQVDPVLSKHSMSLHMEVIGKAAFQCQGCGACRLDFTP